VNRNGGRKEPDGGHRAMITPTGGGAALGSVAMVASALLAVWLTGYVRAFADDRGLLQLPLAIPIAEAITGCGLAYWHVLSRAQMLWALAPVEVLVLGGAGALATNFGAWPWVLAVSACVFIPWLLGMFVGSAARRHGSTT